MLATAALPAQTPAADPAAPEAAPAPLPSPEELSKRHLAAIGGEEAVKKHEHATMKGTISMPSMGLGGPMTSFASEPNLYLMSINMPGVGEVKTGFDGTVAWSQDQMQGPRLMQGGELAQIKREADFRRSLDILAGWDAVKVSGRAEFGGAACIEVEVTDGGEVSKFYFEESSGLHRGSRMTTQSPLGKIQVETVLSDYRDFDGVKVPAKTELSMMGQKQVMTIESISYDPIDRMLFAPPAAIRAIANSPPKADDRERSPIWAERDRQQPRRPEVETEASPVPSLPDLAYEPPNPDGPIVRIPLKGSVGLCAIGEPFFTATDFQLAMRTAATLRPSAIVLTIDSSGGRNDSMREIIAELLLAQQSGTRVIAEVEDAGSAAALIALACKEIVVYPQARLGAAVTLVQREGGEWISRKRAFADDPEAEAKHESFESATHREAAYLTGRAECVSLAMRHRDLELWWSPQSGFTAASNGTADEVRIDSPDTVLTFTSTELVQYSLAIRCLNEADLPSLIGLPDSRVHVESNCIHRTPHAIENIVSRSGSDKYLAERRLKPWVMLP
jgi:hypothetical protein